MWILIKGIDRTTTETELERLLANSLRPPWLPFPARRSSAVRRCEILRITNVAGGGEEYYGLAQLEPPHKARLALEQIGRERRHGLPLSAHQFHRRLARRDRRQPFGEWQGPPEHDRRKGDRRRSNLYIRIPRAPQLERVLGVHLQY